MFSVVCSRDDQLDPTITVMKLNLRIESDNEYYPNRFATQHDRE